jgi:hypothetical protein
MPTWNMNGYVSQLEHTGYQVDILLNENVSITFLKSELADYDLIILRTDSFVQEGASYYCSGDPVTTETSATFASEISLGELQIGACLGFNTKFLQHNYPAGSLRPGLVYAVGGYTAELSWAFLAAGASAFIGYDGSFSLGWGRVDAMSIKMLGYLSQGYAVEDAVIQLYIYLNTGHGVTADWPSPYWSGDGSYKI